MHTEGCDSSLPSDHVAITVCDLDDLLSRLVDGEPRNVSALLAEIELARKPKAVPVPAYIGSPHRLSRSNVSVPKLAPTSEHMVAEAPIADLVKRTPANAEVGNPPEKFPSLPVPPPAAATPNTWHRSQAIAARPSDLRMSVDGPQTKPDSSALFEQVEWEVFPERMPAPKGFGQPHAVGVSSERVPKPFPANAHAVVATSKACVTQRPSAEAPVGKACDADKLVIVSPVLEQDIQFIRVDGTPSTRGSSLDRSPSETVVDMSSDWAADPVKISQTACQNIGCASFPEICEQEEDQNVVEEDNDENAYGSEGKVSHRSDGTTKSKIDEPRRWGLWCAAAICTLTLQWAPLAKTQTCRADWAEDGSVVELSVFESLVDHPKEGFILFVKHLVYPWTAAAFVTAHFDHRGRYRAACMVQKWTWRYSRTMFVRALVLLSQTCVVGACPHNVFLLWKSVDTLGRLLRFLSIVMFDFLTIAKVRMLQQKAAASRCLALVCFSFMMLFIAFLAHASEAHRPFPHNSKIIALVMTFAVVSWGGGKALAAAAMFRAARAAESEAAMESGRRKEKALEASSWTRTTAWATVMYSISLAFLGMSHAVKHSMEQPDRRDWAAQVFFCFAIMFDDVTSTICAAILSGLIGPRTEQHQQKALSLVGEQFLAAAERRVREKLLEVCSKRGTAAAAIQALVDGRDASAIFDQAKNRFRRIPWERLCKMRHLMDGSALDGHGAAPDLYQFSEPCALSDCDVFLSHSWHDNFARKWEALTKWCEEFKAKHGRYPTLWVDKMCINQGDVAEDLQCLPVFLAGCNSMLILAGPTYTSRLWCVMELYVYVMMQSSSGKGETAIEAIALARDVAEQQVVKSSFVSDFAAENCNCAYEDDKAKIMAVIDQTNGGVSAFNTRVKQLAQKVMFRERNPIWEKLAFKLTKGRSS